MTRFKESEKMSGKDSGATQDEQRRRVLLVDDDSAFRGVYKALLEQAGYDIEEAHDRPSAREAFARGGFDVVLLDLMLPPDGSAKLGIAMLEEFLGQRPEQKIIVASGAGDTSFMIQAVRQGAYDFLTKPVDPDVLEVVVARASTRATLERRVDHLKQQLEEASPGANMIGASPPFADAIRVAERVAPSELPILVSGENGTGKELMARFIHQRSMRAGKPMVTINCGALPESLLESTLFGHVRGSFTGAVRDHSGLFSQANGGTLFLDEVGEMPPALQVKLLRAIEYGEILPVGATRPLTVDVRILSATNRDLLEAQANGTFREDLYWRIKGAEIALPPLRERPEDIPLLAQHFLNQAASVCADGKPRALGGEAEAILLRHSWPGNLRELRHEMQRASVMAGARLVLTPEDFDFTRQISRGATGAFAVGDTLQEKIQHLEQVEIRAALAAHDGNRTRAAEQLGLSRQGLLNKMERHGIS